MAGRDRLPVGTAMQDSEGLRDGAGWCRQMRDTEIEDGRWRRGRAAALTAWLRAITHGLALQTVWAWSSASSRRWWWAVRRDGLRMRVRMRSSKSKGCTAQPPGFLDSLAPRAPSVGANAERQDVALAAGARPLATVNTGTTTITIRMRLGFPLDAHDLERPSAAPSTRHTGGRREQTRPCCA